jgi:hypothetical protein
MTTHSLLNTAGSNYDAIITAQSEAFYALTWPSNFVPRLSLDWTKAIVRVFGDTPAWDAVIQNFETDAGANQYIADNNAEWNQPDPLT